MDGTEKKLFVSRSNKFRRRKLAPIKEFLEKFFNYDYFEMVDAVAFEIYDEIIDNIKPKS